VGVCPESEKRRISGKVLDINRYYLILIHKILRKIQVSPLLQFETAGGRQAGEKTAQVEGKWGMKQWNAFSGLISPAARCLAAACFLAFAVLPAIAQVPTPAEPLDIQLARSKVVLVEGREVRQSAASAKPGDVLEEVATYFNRSKGTLRNLEATLPVPLNTELVMSSIKPANVRASTDGATFEPVPLKRRVLQPNGLVTEVAVPLGEYRFLRWYPGELPAAASLSFSARFRVATDSAPPAVPDR
jgi:hypothetical protein